MKAGSECLRRIGDFPVNRIRYKLLQVFSSGDFMDFCPQFAVVEGLGQKSVDAFVCGLNGSFHGGIAGQNDAGNVRIQFSDGGQGLQSVHARHFKIGNHGADI